MSCRIWVEISLDRSLPRSPVNTEPAICHGHLLYSIGMALVGGKGGGSGAGGLGSVEPRLRSFLDSYSATAIETSMTLRWLDWKLAYHHK